MAVSNSITKRDEEKMRLTEALQTAGYQKLIASTLREPKRINRFIANITAAVSASPLLQECDAKSVVIASFQGEALGLSPSPALGEYYLIPYKKNYRVDGEWKTRYVANFQIGTAGLVQLAMRTGQYAKLDSIEIRQGEYLGRDTNTGEARFKFIDDDVEREKLPIIGYMAYFVLLNGFSKTVYFSKERCVEWANRYSKSFNKELYEKIQSGQSLTKDEERDSSSPWYNQFDEMACNLVLRRVLKRAPKSTEMQETLDNADKNEKENNQPIEAKEVSQMFFDDNETSTENLKPEVVSEKSSKEE